MNKVITLSPDLEKDLTEYLRFQLDYHVFESSEPVCGKISHVALTEKEFDGYCQYLSNGVPIQDAMPDTEPPVRVFIYNGGGYCHECMKDLFANTSERIRNGEECFVEFFGFEDDDVPVKEFLALEDEAMGLQRANPEMSIRRKGYHSPKGKIVSETEHFFAEVV